MVDSAPRPDRTLIFAIASRPLRFADRNACRARRLVLLLGLACCGLGPAHADDGRSSSDSQLRALSGSDAAGSGAHASASPIVRPDAVEAADLSRAVAAGNRTSRQLLTPEEDDAGSIGTALLAIAGLVLAVVLISRFNSARE